MSTTDDPSDTPAPPAPRNKPGRPGLGLDEIRDAFERFLSRDGRAPSQTELRRELGDRGSFTTIARARAQLLGERLVSGAETPEAGSSEGVLLKAVGAAMSVLAAEAGTAADALVAAGARQADERVAAAEARVARAEAAAARSELERTRALGRAEVLESEIAEGRTRHRATEWDLAAAHKRESALRDAAGALRSEIAERREAQAHAETAVATLAQRLRDVEAAATLALEGERSARAADAARQREETATAAAREAEHARALARLEERHAGAVARAEEALERAARHERAITELGAARTADVLSCHARIEQLIGALGEAGVGVPALGAPVP